MHTNNKAVHYKHVLLHLCVRMLLLYMVNAKEDHNKHKHINTLNVINT